ncbi:hypothetical protein JW905_08270 [bacterium]|nr:hypothetical protein [candidate division CSSED10-310 bacterium]
MGDGGLLHPRHVEPELSPVAIDAVYCREGGCWMFLAGHMVTSGIAAAGVYFVSGRPDLGVAVFFAGVLLDLDHIPDYFIERGFRLAPGDFFKTCAAAGFKRLFIFLHSWELIPLLLIAGFLLGTLPLFAALAFGVLVHVLADQAANPVKPGAYSFINRARHGFHIEAFLDRRSPIFRERLERAGTGVSPSPPQPSNGTSQE